MPAAPAAASDASPVGVAQAGTPAVLPLACLRRGQGGRVLSLAGESGLRHRLQALGLRPGQLVQVLRTAPWGGPIHLQVGMTELMLRRRDAARIAIAPAPSRP